MKRFQDLYINYDDSKILELIAKISNGLPSHWKRDEIKESDIGNVLGESMYCFRRTKFDSLDSWLWLSHLSSNKWSVTNIIPIEKNELKIQEYNKVLGEFSKTLNSLGINIELTNSEYSIDELISNHAAKALKSFSSNANKSTGSSHPRDADRWFEFLTIIYSENNELNTGDLQKFLIEDGWSESRAIELVIEYEFSMGLLEAFERYK